MIQTKYIIDKNSKTIKNKKHNNKILGPVPSLEDYVSADQWQRIFNSLYLKTDADVVEDTKLTCQEVDKFSGLLQLKPEDIILDLCCGQGRHATELTKRGFKVEGFDRSRYLIQRARSVSICFNGGRATLSC